MAVCKDNVDAVHIPTINISLEPLENVHSYDYGVIVDDKLLFDDVVDEKYHNIKVHFHQLGKMRKYINDR